MNQHKPLTINTPDKTYKEAIVSDPAITSAINASRAAGRIFGAFYKELIDHGVPESYAIEMTNEFSTPLMAAIQKGIREAS